MIATDASRKTGVTIVGAGAVGLVLAARLARSGANVLVVTRREEAARLISQEGIRVEDPVRGERFDARVDVVAGIERAGERARRDPLLLCVRGPDVEEAALALSRVAPDACVACLQNDVDNEERVAARFERVIGGVVRQTSTRLADNAVVAQYPGRLVVGPFTAAASAACRALAERLRAAHYDVGVSPHILEDKWLKLAVNLTSAPNALIRKDDHTRPAFVEIKVRLLEEAKAVFAAAGIRARSCDGRDRSLDEEIAHHRTSLARGTSARRLPLYNQVWAALHRGGPLEADGYHRRVIALGAAAGIATPQNERVLERLLRAYEGGLGPECFGADEIVAR